MPQTRLGVYHVGAASNRAASPNKPRALVSLPDSELNTIAPLRPNVTGTNDRVSFSP
jgi:hypothetical protein